MKLVVFSERQTSAQNVKQYTTVCVCMKLLSSKTCSVGIRTPAALTLAGWRAPSPPAWEVELDPERQRLPAQNNVYGSTRVEGTSIWYYGLWLLASATKS